MELSNEFAVDGNAVAGPLSEIFTFDVTSVQVNCNHCGATNPFAEEIAYVRGPGTVLRCADCTSVVGRFVRTRDSVWMDLTGSASWRIGTSA